MTTSAQAPSLLHPPSFGVLLHQAMRAYGPLCAGVDPHRGLMQAWGLDYTVALSLIHISEPTRPY